MLPGRSRTCVAVSSEVGDGDGTDVGAGCGAELGAELGCSVGTTVGSALGSDGPSTMLVLQR